MNLHYYARNMGLTMLCCVISHRIGALYLSRSIVKDVTVSRNKSKNIRCESNKKIFNAKEILHGMLLAEI